MKCGNFTYLLLFCILLLGLQCRKHSEPPTALPPITQKGTNTFGFKMDGTLWVPYYRYNGYSQQHQCQELSNTVFSRDTSNTNPLPLSIFFSATRKINENDVSIFSIETPMGQGISGTGNKFDSLSFSFLSAHIYGYTHSSGLFEITKLDTANKIIAGVFEFTLYSSGGDSIKITEGRFDLNFNACKISK